MPNNIDNELPIDPKVTLSLKRTGKIFCIIVVVIGFAVLIGWITGSEILKKIDPKWPAMTPVTALALILSSLSLLLVTSGSGTKIKFANIGYALAWLVAIIAMSELYQHFSHPGEGYENISRRENIGTAAANLRMTLFAVLCFLLIAFSIIAMKHGINNKIIQLTSLFVLTISFAGVLKYIFWAKDTSDIFGFEKISLHTSSCFSMLSLGVLLLTPDSGFMVVASNSTVGGKLVRKLLPRIIFLLLILMELRYTAQQFNLIGQDLGTVLSSIIAIVLISFVFYQAGRSLSFEDLKRQEAEHKTKQLNKSLTEQTHDLEQLIYVTSHDLAEPVKTISNYTTLLEKNNTHFDAGAVKYFSFINQSTVRMKEVIRDVLVYTNACKDVVVEQLDCNEMMKTVLNELAEPIAQTKASIHINPLPSIKCYKELKLVFLQLVSNAIKFRKPEVPPNISVCCVSKGDNWQFMVEDNGIGFKMEYADKVFRLGQKLHSKYDYDGTGFGLALVKKIILLHNGEIWVTSEPGMGSTFYFTIPKYLNA